MTIPLIIAIDGGSGTGKSSSAKLLAARLHCLHVNTGAHYRAVALTLDQMKISWRHVKIMAKALKDIKLGVIIEEGRAKITVNDIAYTNEELKAERVNNIVSQYSAMPPVRKALLEYQRSQVLVALNHGFRGVVMEGRDIGTNIFPETPFKYFIVVDSLAKAKRRAAEGIADDMDKRDLIDSTKGQLKEALDAIEVDNTHRTLEETVDFLYENITTRLAKLS
jgi:cytidylate kinase